MVDSRTQSGRSPHRVFVDVNLSPTLAKWITDEFHIEASSLISLGLAEAVDLTIYKIANEPGDIILTKDSDFVDLVLRLGTPPAVVLLTCGNTSAAVVRGLLSRHLAHALVLLESGEQIVEIE